LRTLEIIKSDDILLHLCNSPTLLLFCFLGHVSQSEQKHERVHGIC
jgi:hypothetical protein